MTRRQRGVLIQWAVFVAGAALVALALGVTVDWSKLGNSFFRTGQFREQFPGIITEAARNTILLTIIAFGGGLVLGLLAALMRQSSVAPAKFLAVGYIELFRGIPALVTILMVGYGLPIAFSDYDLPGFFTSIYGSGGLALALVAGAYLAETIRAGIEAVPPGQVEAARSLGLTGPQTMQTIVLPQAFRVILPPLTNELVLLLKDTSLVSVLGIAVGERELAFWGRTISNSTGNYTPLVAAAVVYLVITVPLSQVVQWTERRTKQARR